MGYFLWDLVICIGGIDTHGFGALAHTTSALALSLLGFVRLSFFISTILVKLGGAPQRQK